MNYLKMFFTTILFIFLSNFAFAEFTMQDIQKLKNDKEVVSTLLTKKDAKRLKKLEITKDYINKLSEVFYKSVFQFVNNSNTRCELGLISIFKKNLEENNYIVSFNEVNKYLKVLRQNHYIDDILLNFTININKDLNSLEIIESNDKTNTVSISQKKTNKLLKNNDISDLYYGFKSWPNEVDQCAYQEFNYIKSNLNKKSDENQKKLSNKKKLRFIKDLNKLALKEGYIEPNTYQKLEYFRKKSFIAKRSLRIKDYFNIVFYAKNKMKTVTSQYETNDIEKEYNFSSKRLKRFRKLTRRMSLYNKYDETQIIMLAQIFQKASRRMGVDPDTESGVPVISQKFSVLNENGERENYVETIELDTQSQYNFARRRLRNDMNDLQAMDIFYDKEIYFNDIVMAAFETGYITIEDLEAAISYDDLWNPSKSKVQRIVGYIFRITGIASFFLPPPLNIIAPLAISITEGIVENKISGGQDYDNPSTIIN